MGMKLDLTMTYIQLFYFKTLNVYIPTLAKIIMSKALNFQLSDFGKIHQVSVFDINVKRKLVQIFVTPEKGSTKTV